MKIEVERKAHQGESNMMKLKFLGKQCEITQVTFLNGIAHAYYLDRGTKMITMNERESQDSVSIGHPVVGKKVFIRICDACGTTDETNEAKFCKVCAGAKFASIEE
jgi:hypothetical protein